MGEQRVPIVTEADVVTARRAGRSAAQELGFGSADQARLAAAISELARNVIQYAGTGTCAITGQREGAAAGIRVVIEDSGPGISDIEQAMTEGFTSADGLGRGLNAARRLVHDFAIESGRGHTRVTISMTRKSV